ncbi:MAG: hypothetical protein AABY22_08850 [Nanoarchaeota archaeon]
METKKCKICGIIIEGFSVKDVKYRMLMHSRSKKCLSARKQLKNEN